MVPYDCRRCGNRHAAWQCPAYGKTCAKCKGRNHFARMCFWEEKTESKKKRRCILERCKVNQNRLWMERMKCMQWNYRVKFG